MLKFIYKYIKFICLISVFVINLPLMAQNSIYDFSFKDIDGNSLILNDFKGKPILLVNTASKCGFTPQYGDLQSLFQEYKDTDLVFIASPSNDFKQEYSSEEEIKKFCLINYGVKFYVTESVVLIGETAHPLYTWLNNDYHKSPKWNFYKYLFDRNGSLVNSWSSITKPTSIKIKRKIKKIL